MAINNSTEFFKLHDLLSDKNLYELTNALWITNQLFYVEE